MAKKKKGQKSYKLTSKDCSSIEEMHAKKQTFWSKVTGGRMY